jgi:tetratricopeptide (TPR) repeat protein
MAQAGRRLKRRVAAASASAAPSPHRLPGLGPTPSWVWLALGALLLAAYGNALTLGLAVDAPFLLTNPRLAALTRENVELILTKPYWWPSHTDDLYRPITTLSFLLGPGDMQHPFLLHLVNVLLHGLCVWLAFRFSWRVMRSATAAAAIAAIFAVHPVGVDTVTNIAGRADLLATAAVLAGLLAHVRALEEPGRAWLWRGALGLVTLAGVFSKENAVLILPLLLLYDFASGPEAPSWREGVAGAWRRGRGSYVVVGGVLVILAIVRRAVMSDELPHWQPFGDNPLTIAGFWSGRLTALAVLGRSLLLLAWPATLSADYSYDQIPVIGAGASSSTHIAWVLTLVAIGAVLGLCWRVRRSQPALFFWVLFCLGTRLPTANLVVLIGSIMAERFLYLPALGFAGAVVSVALIGMQWWTGRPGANVSRVRAVGAVAAVFALLALGARTMLRNLDWRDDGAIWRSAIRACPDSNKPYKGLARVVYREGRLDEAIALMEQSLAVFERRVVAPVDYSSDLLQGLGEYYMEKGDALRDAGKAAEGRAFHEKAMAILERAVSTDRATNERVRALQLARGDAESEIHDVGVLKMHETAGSVALRLGDLERARRAFEWYRHLDPTHADAFLGLAAVAAQGHRGADEAMYLLEAMILEPGSDEVWAAFTPVLRREGIRGIALENGRLRIDAADPAVAGLVNRACPDLITVLREGKRFKQAADAQSICDRRLGYR